MFILPDLYQEIAFLSYQHKEGGRYAYVKLLSLTRELPDLLNDPEDRIVIEKLRQRLNESLCDRFTLAQEKFFEGARLRILRILSAPSKLIEVAASASVSNTRL